MRKLAGFFIWLGLFGLFLAFAASSVGSPDNRLLLGSLLLLTLGWLILRRPRKGEEPSRRFRTLRRLGLIGSDDELDPD